MRVHHIPAKQANDLLEFLLKEAPWDTNQKLGYAKRETIWVPAEWDWNPTLSGLAAGFEEAADCLLNSVLLNLYRVGDANCPWHSDDDPGYVLDNPIVSLSLGSPRTFLYRLKEGTCEYGLKLDHGSWIIMPAGFQRTWEHSVPADPEIKEPRVNLTFRLMGE